MDNRGRSSLGLCHPLYDVKGFIASFEQATEIRFGWLDKFFNEWTSYNAVQVIRLPKKKFCRVAIINGPGMNNSRTQPHEISYKETTKSLEAKILRGDREFLRKFNNRLNHVKQVTDQAPPGSLTLAISPWLEHEPITKKTFEILASEIRKVFGPNILIVDNPRHGPLIPGHLHERHGSKVNPAECDIVDLDGEDIETMEIQEVAERFKNVRCFYGWGLSENGNSKDQKDWLPPQKRTNFPKRREHEFYKYFMRPDALTINSPLDSQDIAGTKQQNPNDGFKREFVWKLGDGRNFAVCLFPRNFRQQFKSVVVKKNGKVIDRGRYRGKYTEDGTNRLIYDFTKHTSSFPDNCVVIADKNSWVIDKPQFRED